MNERHGGTGLLIARVAALSFSIGIVGTLMMRAGLGCAADDAQKEAIATVDAPPATSLAGPEGATAPAATQAPTHGGYMGDSKMLDPRLVDKLRDPPSSPTAPAKPSSPPPTFFPGSKWGPPVQVKPSPTPQENATP